MPFTSTPDDTIINLLGTSGEYKGLSKKSESNPKRRKVSLAQLKNKNRKGKSKEKVKEKEKPKKNCK